MTANRLKSPTTLNEKGDLSGPSRSARRRKEQTKQVAMEIHGGCQSNMEPAYCGLFGTLVTGAPTTTLTKMFSKSPVITTKVIPNIVNKNIQVFEKSQVNFVRSVNVLYNNGLVSKAKYNSIRSALTMCCNDKNTAKSHIEFMPKIHHPRIFTYKELMAKINAIDIGTLHDVKERFCYDLGDEEQVDGKYRDLAELLLRLAQFYLTVDKHRIDKLTWFCNEVGCFKVAIGGDGAPFGKDNSALAWLVSFLNCGNRVCSRDENFLLLGAHCSEDCMPISRYVIKLCQDMKEIERKTFSVTVDDKLQKVSFTFDMFPNDMKYLAFLAGELTISAKYFSPFANVNTDEMCDTKSTFGTKTSDKWKPWTYNGRLKAVLAVDKKKQELSQCRLKPKTLRSKVTTYLADKLSSRNEFKPLLGQMIDRAKAEPLHLKNNAWQQWHIMVLNYTLSRTDVSMYDSVGDTPGLSCFRQYYEALRHVLKATRLAKKVRKWFSDGRLKNLQFQYRFTGKESRIMCHNFMKLVTSLALLDDQPSHLFQLHTFAVIGLNLRDAVSLFSRIKITHDELISLKNVSHNYFVGCALFSHVTPTTWTIGHVIPVHAEQVKHQLGFGLGINTMEGRESKHISLAKFATYTNHSNFWFQVFRHEYISLFWLRENGCDSTKYTPTKNKYVPGRCSTAQFCHCGLPKLESNPKCDFCSHACHQVVVDSIEKGKVTADVAKYITIRKAHRA